MISDTIKLLNSAHFYNGGEKIEIAKGRDELVLSFSDFKNKIKRVWRLKK